MNQTVNSNPWVVQEAKQAVVVPDGAYLASFKGVVDFEMKQEGKAPAVKWRFAWEILAGEYAHKIATTLTEREISPNALAGRLIAGMLGRAIQAGENVKAAVDACVGKTYMIVVQPGPKGGKSCVRVVSQPPQI